MDHVNPYAGLGTNIFNLFKDFLVRNQQNYDRAIEVDRMMRAGKTPEALYPPQDNTYYGTWNPTPAERAMANEELAARAIDEGNAAAYDAAMADAGMGPQEPIVPMLDAASMEAIAQSLGLDKAPVKSKPRARRKARNLGQGSDKIEVLRPDILARQQESGIREYVNEASDNYWKGREAELDRVRKSLGLS